MTSLGGKEHNRIFVELIRSVEQSGNVYIASVNTFITRMDAESEGACGRGDA